MLEDLTFKSLGIVNYHETLEQMRAHINEDEFKNEIWILEHPPIFTLGTAADKKHILESKEIPVVQSDRGGEVTYHGPGQLMIYFLINLKRLGWGPKRFICELENIIISLLLKYEIKAERKGGAPGIYVAGKKIASIGLKIKRGLCYHGISLNIDMDLTPYNGIVTCGIESLDVVQVTDFTDITMNQIKEDLTDLIRENSLKVA